MTLKPYLVLILATEFVLAVVQPGLAQTYSVLYTFTGGSDGGKPFARVILDSAGNIYGTTQHGGDPICSCGVVFKVDIAGIETVLHTFTDPDGADPTAALVRDTLGNLYGTTSAGGSNGFGTVFKLGPSGTITTLHSFTGQSDGASPEDGVAMDAAGNLYGVTLKGGSFQNCTSGCGVLYKITPSGTFKILHEFLGGAADGIEPTGIPYVDSRGHIYGATADGGDVDGISVGSVYVYANNSAYKQTFLKGNHGPVNPQGGLIQDAVGNFYGTSDGGKIGYGTVFSLNANEDFTGFFSFTGTDGQNPVGTLTMDLHGNIYGVTFNGGANGDWGTVFEITPTGEIVLHSFDLPAEGQTPTSGVTIDATGNLYGSTYSGGDSSNSGVLFKIAP